MTRPTAPVTTLPAWSSVLAVVAHPDDESFGLGAVLAAYVEQGARVSVLCFTHGESSTLNPAGQDLYRIRGEEYSAAARALGVEKAVLRAYPDGELSSVCRTRLVGDILDVARVARPDGLLVFDCSGVTGHADHAAASSAACAAGDVLELPVLGWTVSDDIAGRLNAEAGTAFTGHRPEEIDFVVAVPRERQRRAIDEHASQAVPDSILWRRLQLQGDVEPLRWLRPPAAVAD